MEKKLSLIKKNPEGYKQTEIGVIPEDWDVDNLGKFVQIRSGESPSKFKISKYGVPYFKVDQLNNSIKYQKETPYFVDIANTVRAKSLIFPKRGAAIYQNKIRILAQDSYMDTNLMTLTVDSKIDYEYLFYYLNKKGLSHIADVTSVPQINNKHIIPFKIIFPKSKSEQTAIATVLSDADALIEFLEKLIAKKKAIKQGTMQKLLTGKKRLPGFSGEWEVKKLGKIGNCIRGVSYNGERDLSSHDTNTTVRLLRSNNVQNGTIDLSELQFVNISRVKPIQALQKNDIVICMANGSKQLVGKSAIFDVSNNYNYTFGAFMGCFRTNSNQAVSRYISFTFQTYQYRSYIDVLLSGSSINNLKPSDIESIEIPYPKQAEQTAIATILSDMDAEIESLEQKRDKYTMLKQGMMQQLLTGRIRIYANN